MACNQRRAADVCANPTTTWTGAVSGAWTDPFNWMDATQAGTLPNSSDDVCVPADCPFDPTIARGLVAPVDTIEVQIGGTLMLSGEMSIQGTSSIATLTLSGITVQLTNNGALTADTALNMNRGTVLGSGLIGSNIGTNFATANTKFIGNDFRNNGTLVVDRRQLGLRWQDGHHAGTWRAQAVGDSVIAGT